MYGLPLTLSVQSCPSADLPGLPTAEGARGLIRRSLLSLPQMLASRLPCGSLLQRAAMQTWRCWGEAMLRNEWELIGSSADVTVLHHGSAVSHELQHSRVFGSWQ